MPPKLSAKDLEVYYHDCRLRGTQDEDGKAHNCMKGEHWPHCWGRWELYGEVWSDWCVLNAVGKPVETWRRFHLFPVEGVHGEVVEWERLWRSPSSTSSSVIRPEVPRGGRIMGRAKKPSLRAQIRCKIREGDIFFEPGIDERLVKYLES